MPPKVEKLNLSWGSPDFLHDYWSKKSSESYTLTPEGLSYLYTGIDELKTAIKKLHKQEKNAMIDDKFVVIGNGAGQILSAIIYALDLPVSANSPYFPRFKHYTKFAGQSWLDNRHPEFVQIITCPNNPDNNIYHQIHSKYIIYDLSYNWYQYHEPIEFNEDIMVFSLSKCTGHASARIGWALIKDEQIVKKMEEYIEFATGGISIYSQLEAEKIIRSQLDILVTIFEYGRIILDKRWKKLHNLQKLSFVILNSSGMFIWCVGKCPKSIISTPGEKFGVSNDYFRISVGCSEEKFEKLLWILQKSK